MPTLNWIGKSAVVNHDQQVPYRLIHCDGDLSVGEAGEGNLLVEGDNLHALKALLPYYRKQVKCVYIDPPYNTGNEGWVYNDNVNSPEIKKWLGEAVGGEAEDLSRHDKWLCMMYPRLVLLREFLRDDGAIFISIDDNEVAHLRCVMDEIFRAQNFIANIVWQKKQSPQNDAINLSDMHDHILVYAKRAKTSRDDPYGWQRQLLIRGNEQDKRYSNPDNDPRGDWTSVDYTCNKSAEERPNLYYSIINPTTGEEIWPSRKAVWRFEKSSHEQNISENRVWWGVTGTARPRLKKFRLELADGIVPSTWWDKEFAGTNQEARKEIRALFDVGEADFSTPKPARLLKCILQLATDKDSLVLDSFAGSGTTGHAVLQANKEDGGNRRFVLIEMEPEICRNITAERLRRIIVPHLPGASASPDNEDQKRRQERGSATPLSLSGRGAGGEGLGGGFRYCTLGEPLFDERGQIRDKVKFGDLAHHIFFTETGEPLPKRVTGRNSFIGEMNGTAYYLLWGGPGALNVLNVAALRQLKPHDGPKVIYADACRLSPSQLQARNIVFKQIPYEVKAG